MFKQKHILRMMLALLLTYSTAQAQNRYELTVRDAVELAYQNVVELKNAQLDYRIQESVNKETFGKALPQVAANLGTQYFLKLPQILFPMSDANVYEVLKKQQLIPATTEAPPPTLVPFSLQQPWNLSMGATLTQLLFQPDVFVGLQARQTALDLSSSMIEQTKEKVKDSAYKRYYAILIAEKQLYFLNESVKRLQKLYHDDSIMYKNGFAEKLDLDRVQVQLNNLNNTVNMVQSGVTLSYAALKFALGLPQQDTVVLKEELTAAALKENVLDENFKYEDRAELRTLDFTRRLQELNKKRYEFAKYPTVALAGNYTINAQGQKFFTDNSTRWLKSSYVGVSISVPVFDGFQRKERVKQAQLNVDKIKNTITNVKQAIDFEQLATKESLKNALTNLDLQERNVALAEKVYNSVKLKFETGIGSSFEVLQADQDYQTAQANYFSALYNATVAKISYQYSLGKLQ